MDKKLGVIVPYRDRYEQLIVFKKSIQDYLTSKNIKFELIIVEQDGAKIFNRGKLLNIGFLKAKQLKCDYVVFHDVDMIPVDVDYSFTDYPVHLATNFIPENTRIIFDEYFGGVTIFPIVDFERVNGYSNEYWGWGFEDTDLLYRCKINNISLDKKELTKTSGSTASLKFNGINSYVKSSGDVFINNDGFLTIFVSFCSNDFTLNDKKFDDEYVIFSTSTFKIKYNSYQRYTVELQDKNGEYSYINSNIIPPYKTNIIVTIDLKDNKMVMYQDGLSVGETTIKDDFKFDNDKFYLGCEEYKNFFDGQIVNFAVYNSILSENEIKEISNNQHFGLTQSFGNYKSQYFLKIYYDSKYTSKNKILNLVEQKYDGEINNCDIVKFTFDDKNTIEIPHRKPGTFKLLPHKENGYVNGSWKEITTRYNQLKYHNEVLKNRKNIRKDGLSNCEYKQHNILRIDKITHINVAI